ncbi:MULTISPECIES: hypothetical protein [Streptomyces]|uniref:Lipoprotein n=1 Tax=Streptomyces ramulosus TaxID=47762 RepID=A0ABW1FDA5_9ACTN
MKKALVVGSATAALATLSGAVAPAASASPIPPGPADCAPPHRKYHIMNKESGGMEGTVAININACGRSDTAAWGEIITEAEAGDKVGVFGGTVLASGPETVDLRADRRVMTTRIDYKQCLPVPVDWTNVACIRWASWLVEHSMIKTPDGKLSYFEKITQLPVYGRDPNRWPGNAWRIDTE